MRGAVLLAALPFTVVADVAAQELATRGYWASQPANRLAAPPVIAYSPPVNVANTPWISQAAAIAHAGANRIFIAWQEVGLIACSHSGDGGATFSPRVFVAPGAEWLSFGQVRLAALGADDLGAVFTAFNVDYGGAEIVYAASTDAGDSFPSLHVVSSIDGINSYTPDIATGWGIAVAWSNSDFSGSNSIELAVSSDAGASFSQPRRIDASTAFVTCPAVALAGTGSLFVAWFENDDPFQADQAAEIFFSASNDGGETFTLPVNVSNTPDEKSWCPRMAVDDAGTVYLVWVDGEFGPEMKIRFTRSENAGASFSTPRVLAGPAPNMTATVTAVGEGAVWAAWTTVDEADGARMWLSRSGDGGETFGEPSLMPGAQAEITAVSATELFAAWHEGDPLSDVFFTRAALEACGDANGDDSITATDAFIALKAAAGSASCDASLCDIDRSGAVTAADALAIVRVSLGLPVEHWCTT